MGFWRCENGHVNGINSEAGCSVCGAALSSQDATDALERGLSPIRKAITVDDTGECLGCQ